MACKELIAALSMIVAASAASAGQPETTADAGAPEAPPEARYCLRAEVTGTRIESVVCLTREEWAEGDVDVDKEWAEDGVKVIV